MAIVPTVSMSEATMGIPFQLPLLFRNAYWRSSSTLARLGASDRLGRMSTSSKSSFGSLSMRKFGELQGGQVFECAIHRFLDYCRGDRFGRHPGVGIILVGRSLVYF